MTQEEQQQVNAMMRFYEAQVANITREGAQAAGVAESLAIRCAALTKELDALKPKPEPKLEVVP